jgi:hypothetical protein
MKPRKESRMGRPPKPDKFDAFISFPCHKPLADALEAYRKKHGLRSKGEAGREIIAKATGVKL